MWLLRTRTLTLQQSEGRDVHNIGGVQKNGRWVERQVQGSMANGWMYCTLVGEVYIRR